MKKYRGLILYCDKQTIEEVRQIVELGKGKLVHYYSSNGQLFIVTQALYYKICMFKKLLEKPIKNRK